MKDNKVRQAVDYLKGATGTVRSVARSLGITDTLLHKYMKEGRTSYPVACKIEVYTGAKYKWSDLVNVDDIEVPEE